LYLYSRFLLKQKTWNTQEVVNMLKIKSFTFNLYQENTFVISDESGSGVVIDPGCYSQQEEKELADYIEKEGVRLEYLLNTHGHIDHMLGNHFVKNRYGLKFATHKIVVEELASVPAYAALMGLSPTPSPDPDILLEAGEKVTFGNSELEVIFTPGHSPGHISFFHRKSGQLFSGDVLFQGSIGRVDLPGGSYPVLMDSIMKKVLPLGDDVRVYCGHGPTTTIGRERLTNPFILNHLAQ
jgi:glyoxylase-like metal-dependent hydrolase (beta-lactamase superfamily II)